MNAVIETTHLFPLLDAHLFALLESLKPADWEKQTIAGAWRVKDVAAHLLDGNIRAISMLRDGYFGNPLQLADDRYETLVAGLNGLNADWVKAMKRVSPTMLVFLLKQTGPAFCNIMENLPPHEDAIFSVAWAGQQQSPNWLHVAREYSEKWIHQMQIRRALNVEAPLMEPTFFKPLMHTLLMGVPHALRGLDCPVDSQLVLHITSGHPMVYYWQLTVAGWRAVDYLEPDKNATHVTVEPYWAWVLFSKSVRPSTIPNAFKITGNQHLGNALLNMVSVMA